MTGFHLSRIVPKPRELYGRSRAAGNRRYETLISPDNLAMGGTYKAPIDMHKDLMYPSYPCGPKSQPLALPKIL